MPVFMIERRYAEQLEASAEDADGINRINDEEGVRWLYSFLSADKRKTYCLYEAPSPDAIRRAAARAGVPADVVVEVSERVLPDGSQRGDLTESPSRQLGARWRSGPPGCGWSCPVFIRMLRMWLAAVLALMNSRAAISRLLRPAASSPMTSTSRAVS